MTGLVLSLLFVASAKVIPSHLICILFALIEGLTSYIHHHESHGLLHGVRICRGTPSISHLLFVDDNFLFCKASVLEVTNLKHVLDTYEAASGQALNYQKSAIAYSRNTEANCRSLINNLLGVIESTGHGKYLGLPFIIGS
jgi:hypothetical protein